MITIEKSEPIHSSECDAKIKRNLEDARHWAEVNIEAYKHVGYVDAKAKIWQIVRGIDKGSWEAVIFAGRKVDTN